ncbi:hypothetical protein JMJ35_006720 [Cladonia borealis]|uniref:O-methyltransferase n=1 Tax=Cladonia borealis TaxID=184061 RepID=A0AA39V0J4_9LECA|nr:hypothetical protein JMJ35_006720 [Cladonia borealis]
MSTVECVQPEALKTMLPTLEGITQASFNNDGERNKALLAAYALINRLESPWETVCRLAMTQPALGASLKVVKDLKLFETWHQQGDIAMTHKELAKLVTCNELLLQRLVRHLAANNMLEEVSPGRFTQTAFTLALLQPVFGEWINYMYDATIPCFHKMPEYLAETGYLNPTDPENGVFQYTKGSTGNLFDYYNARPQEGDSFNHVMGGVMAHQASWLSIYPHETLVQSASEGSPILVDVGGNVGHDLERFRLKHPEIAERLVLQDRPDVIALSKCPNPVQKMSHDFFTPQPVKGARAYYLHGVLHDWSDEHARKILEMLKPAMKPGYSKLLVHEHVLPESRPHPQATAYDLTMMVKVAALERSETMWRELLASCGFNVMKIWTSSLMTQSIIEAELA